MVARNYSNPDSPATVVNLASFIYFLIVSSL
jgi:hypothetical protein